MLRVSASLLIFGLYLLGCPGSSSTVGISPTDLSKYDGEALPPTDVLEVIEVGGHGAIPDGAICVPETTQCIGSHFLKCNEKGTDWSVTTCEAGTYCTPDGCKATKCQPNQAECDKDGNVVVCLPDGSGFGEPTPCKEDEVCAGGMCLKAQCIEGEKQCAQTSILECKGGKWTETPCQEGQICFKASCIECFTDSHCKVGLKCIEGLCVTPPLEVLTKELPDGVVNTPYSAVIEAQGGTPPYTFTVAEGSLPPGLTLSEEGKVSGTPTQPGHYNFKAKAEDKAGAVALANISITIHASGLSIASKSPLPDAEDGTPYSFQFKAVGGLEPYGWMILSGKLPKGLTLAYDGLLSGTPSGPGPYEFMVRVVDASDPVQMAKGTFKLNVKVAPLEIIGDQVINLFLTKAVILPIITVVEGIPIPYSVQLQAKGGVKPYHWAEVQIPGFIKTFLPKAGIPQGLTLSDSGLLSGAVTSTDSVMQLQIPFLNFTLTGFFFMAEVKDSQSPPASDQAIFVIPTVPVNFGGGLPF